MAFRQLTNFFCYFKMMSMYWLSRTAQQTHTNKNTALSKRSILSFFLFSLELSGVERKVSERHWCHCVLFELSYFFFRKNWTFPLHCNGKSHWDSLEYTSLSYSFSNLKILAFSFLFELLLIFFFLILHHNSWHFTLSIEFVSLEQNILWTFIILIISSYMFCINIS